MLNRKTVRKYSTATLLAGVCVALLACSSDSDRPGATVKGGGKRAPALNPQSRLNLPQELPAANAAPVVADASVKRAPAMEPPAPAAGKMTVPASMDNATGPYTPHYKTDHGYFDSGLFSYMFGPEKDAGQNNGEETADQGRKVPMDNPGGLRTDEMTAAPVPVASAEPYPSLSSVPPAPTPLSAPGEAQQTIQSLEAARVQSEAERQALAGPSLEQEAANAFASASPAPAPLAPMPENTASAAASPQWEPPVATAESAMAPTAPSYPSGPNVEKDEGFVAWLGGLFGGDETQLPPPRQRIAGNPEPVNQAVPVAPVQQAALMPPPAPVASAPEWTPPPAYEPAAAPSPAPRSTFAAAPQIDPVPATVSSPPPVQTMADQGPIQLTEPSDSGRYLMLTPPEENRAHTRSLPESRYAARRMSTYR